MQTALSSSIERPDRPLVKVCGLTRPDEALACARMGADAIGLVFYPQSPRHLTAPQAVDICRCLPEGVTPVAVCVDLPSDEILNFASECGCTTVQLHGRETPNKVARLRQAGLRVVKALFASRPPEVSQAPHYDAATAFLIECGAGRQPGGNARAWDWTVPAGLFEKQPVILAGGLTPGNVRRALRTARPDAVDVSSGVERTPGRKDLEKVKAFLAAVKGCPEDNRIIPERSFKRIF